jgi:hydroxypyruvate reductase
MSPPKPEILSVTGAPADIEAALDAAYTVHRHPADMAGVDWSTLAGVRGLVSGGGTGAPADWIDRLPALEIVAINGVGVDKVDFAKAAERGIQVSNTPDVLNDDVADLAVGLLIALARGFCVNDRFVRDGRWAAGEGVPLARSVRNLNVGIVGLGRIGLAIAARLEPMVASIAYHNRNPRPETTYRYVDDLERLARECDALIVITSGGAHTQKLISAPVIDALGPTGLLINVARGSVVDEEALVAALVEGRLGGAGLDVFADEPNVPAALLELPNVVMQPHIGSATVDTRRAMGQLVVDNLAAHFAGRPLVTPVG